MADRTKKELIKHIVDLEAQVEYWKQEDTDNTRLLNEEGRKRREIAQRLSDFREKSKDWMTKMQLNNANLVTMIHGMASGIADLDSIPNSIKLPLFLKED